MDAINWVSLATRGHAPTVGCDLLGVGYEDAFDNLIKYDIEGQLGNGYSSMRLVVGPYGSGKTHFLRQLTERAAARGVVAAEVKLDRDIDYTHRLVVYKEVARELRVPGVRGHGMGHLLRAIRDHVASPYPEAVRDEAFASWVDGLLSAGLELDVYARVASTAFRALERDDEATFLAAERWLSGEVNDSGVVKLLPVGRVSPDYLGREAKLMLLSLFQLIRHAGFTGTIVTMDEAEQSFSVERRRRQRILEAMKSDVDDIADLRDGSVLVVYAITPDIHQDMASFAALQQRFADPRGRRFFDGEPMASVIDLTFRKDPTDLLRRIARRLVEVYAARAALPGSIPVEEAIATAESMAEEVTSEDQSASSRRVLVKRVCCYLLERPYSDDPGPGEF